MEKIYYENQYIKEFTAEVINIIEKDNKFHVELDKTAFFPGGGGQGADLGFIENHEVKEVYENEGIVYHVVDKKPIKIHRVKCKIDWERRLDGMQQHLGQHLLSGVFFNLFNANTVSIHLGEEISTVDINGVLEENQIREAEKVANEMISKSLEVRSFVPKKSELKKLKLRRDLPKTREEIRVLEISDLDINACCGVHPRNTLELQIIKIKKHMKNKGNTRIEFLAGRRAVNDCFIKDTFAREICNYLTSNEEEAINGIKNLNTQLKTSIDENRNIREELNHYKIREMLAEGQNINGIKVVEKIFENDNVKNISKLATRINEMEGSICIFVLKSASVVNMIFSASKDIKCISMNDLLKDSISLIDGKGGGSPFLAQGAGKNINNLEYALEYAMKKIKDYK